jgi:Flp pilus assembly protein TadG
MSSLRDSRGAAAAEMAMVTPLLLILLFGSVETGKYFMDEHTVVKAVRDGARFAARQQMINFVTSAGACQAAVPQDVADRTKKLVRTGNVAGTGARLPYWTSNDTVTVTSACYANAAGEDMKGIYGGAAAGAPVVTVSATVPYSPLLGLFGVPGGLNLEARQEAAVTGV